MAQNFYYFRIESRKKSINEAGVTRNRKYKEYLDSGFEYNQLKKAFYDVTHLAILDGDISEDGKRMKMYIFCELDATDVYQLCKNQKVI